VTLDDFAEEYDWSGGRMICLRTCRRLLGWRGPDGEAVGMPDVMQVQRRVKDALEGHHGEQEHEGESERAPALRHGGEKSQSGHEQGGRHRRVSTQSLP
jgi:hypothetical protein